MLHSHPIHNIHFRLFEIQVREIDESWFHFYVQDTYWRLYRNGQEGASIWMGDIEVPLLANRLYFVPSGVRFTGRNERAIEHFYVHFDTIGVPPHLMRDLFSAPILLAINEAIDRDAEEIVRNFDRLASDDLTLQCRVKSLLYQGLALYLGGLPEERRSGSRQITSRLEAVQPALAEIEMHLGERLTIGTLAASCAMSEDHFIKRFHECVGQTPNRYIQFRRVTAAAQELLFTTRTIEQIAEQHGFGNRFYFARVFGRHMGVSPAAYRKTARV